MVEYPLELATEGGSLVFTDEDSQPRTDETALLLTQQLAGRFVRFENEPD